VPRNTRWLPKSPKTAPARADEGLPPAVGLLVGAASRLDARQFGGAQPGKLALGQGRRVEGRVHLFDMPGARGDGERWVSRAHPAKMRARVAVASIAVERR
jgi:hypothetical protein